MLPLYPLVPKGATAEDFAFRSGLWRRDAVTVPGTALLMAAMSRFHPAYASPPPEADSPGPVGLTCASLAMGLFCLYVHVVTFPIPLKSAPSRQAQRLLGRIIYLTRQGITFVAAHLLASGYAELVQDPRLRAVCHGNTAVVGAFGLFVSVQFYSLVWPSPEFKEDAARLLKSGVDWSPNQHCAHLLPGLLVLLDVLLLKQPGLLRATLPAVLSHLKVLLLYCLSYLAFIAVNKRLTGEWPYGLLNRVDSVAKWGKFLVVQASIFCAFCAVMLALAHVR